MKVTYKGVEILIDKQDLPLLSLHNWSVRTQGYLSYRVWNGGTEYLHRLIAGTPNGAVTDHINRNPRDNRRSNLRVCSSSDNNRNTAARSSTGYKWIYKDNCKGWPYRVQREDKTLGRFRTLTDAVAFTGGKK